MKASIIIPTHNRIHSLLRTIDSALRQDFPKADYEVIVVENGCTDQTKVKVTERIKKEKTVNLRIISEDSIGLHFARHRGVMAAKSGILIFSDDDATFDSNLIKVYVDAFNKHPKMAAAGGPVRPKWEKDPPTWLKEFIGELKIFTPLSLMDPYKKFHLDKKGYFFGVNMVIRKKTLFEVGGFNPELIGDAYVGDGEFGLNKKLWRKKLLIGYIPSALVYHHIPKERMTLNYLKMRMRNEGISTIYSQVHPHIPNRGKLFILSFTKLFMNLKLFIASVVRNGKTDVNSLNIQLTAEHQYSQICYLTRLIFSKNLRSIVRKSDWLN